MSKILKQGFISRYEIHDISSIKIIASGEFENKAYSASLQFKSSVIEQVDDEKFGLIDKEQTYIFKIYSDDSELKAFNTWLRSLDLSKKALILNCTAPILQAKDVYTLTSLHNSADVMLLNSSTAKEVKSA